MVSIPKVKIGFCNLSLPHLEREVKVKGEAHAKNVVQYLENDLKVQVYVFPGLIENRDQAIECWQAFQKENVEAVILFNGTFSMGELTAEIVRNLDCPFVIWGITEQSLLPDHDGAFTGSMVGVMAAGSIFKNLGKQFTFVYDTIDQKDTQTKITTFVKALRGIVYLRNSRIGIVGMRPDGFQICGYDELAIKKTFGTELINISTHTIGKVIAALSNAEVEKDMVVYENIFRISAEDRERAKGGSKMYIALKKAIEEKNLQAITSECWPEFRDIDQTPVCPAHSRLTSQGIMTACECDVDGALSMLLGYALSEKPVFFADLTYVNEDNDTLLFWHCGNGPHALTKPGRKACIEDISGSLLVNMVLKAGIVTICRLNSIGSEFTLHVGRGEVKETEQILNGSHVSVRIGCGNMKFVESSLEHGIPHHNAVIHGDVVEECNEFARHTGINFVKC